MSTDDYAKPVGNLDKLSLALISLLVALLFSTLVLGMSSDMPPPPGLGPVFMGLFLITLGVMFFASYFYSARSFFLRWLLQFASGFPGLATPKMTFFFSFLCVLSELGAIADGLGLNLL